MIAEPVRLPAEIAHVLFMDLVAYSQLSMEEQARQVRELRQLVREAPEVRRAHMRRELICLDTGDGMALVFFRDPVAPAQCAMEIAGALARHPDLQLRMGIHCGPISHEPGINGEENVSGSGINTAQRVMDCGDAGHILASHSSAEFVGQFETWSQAFHDLGECPVKHGARLHLFNLCVGEIGNPRVPEKLRADLNAGPLLLAGGERGPESEAAPEPAGGAVPIGSAFYIERPADAQFHAALARRDSIVLVKGPRQIGKTSLLARGLQRAREAGVRVVLTDLQKLAPEQLESAGALFRAFAEMISDQLDLDVALDDLWNPRRGWNVNFERFLRREVLGRPVSGGEVSGESGPDHSPLITHHSPRLVWGLDEVDRLFSCPFSSVVFGLFRSWHNERSLNPEGPWGRLTLAIAYATEAHLFITDLNQSPFNVGTRLALEDFTQGDVAELNRRHGTHSQSGCPPLRDAAEIERYFRLVGGHPYLARRGLHAMSADRLEIGALEAQADSEEGIFGDHLGRMLAALTQDAELCDAVRAVAQGEPCPTAASFYRLRSAGVLAGNTPAEARPRCRLYAIYLQRHLP